MRSAFEVHEGAEPLVPRERPWTAREQLAWFFVICPLQMGLRANFSEFLWFEKEGNVDERTPEAHVERVTAYRRILGWLRTMPDADAGVLQVAYETRVWPEVVRQRFGTLAGVVVRITCAGGPWPDDETGREAVLAARAADLDKRCLDPAQGRAMKALLAVARGRVRDAVRAYCAARGAGRALIPEEDREKVDP